VLESVESTQTPRIDLHAIPWHVSCNAEVSPHFPMTNVIIPPSPQCQSCQYLMPSQSSKTGLRCGFAYFKASEMVRKFKLMSHYPEVKSFNACEKWAPK
jgi:hypothetical protein